MALSKIIPTPYGVDATYHKINNIAISWHNKTCFVDFYSYLNLEARENDKYPLSSMYYEFINTDFTFQVEDNITERVYEKIKLLPEWQDATDC